MWRSGGGALEVEAEAWSWRSGGECGGLKVKGWKWRSGGGGVSLEVEVQAEAGRTSSSAE